MDQSQPTPPPPVPSRAEQFTRAAFAGFLMLALVTLAFGLAWGIQEMRHDDDGSTPTGGATARPAANGGPATATSRDSIGAAILDEIYSILSSQYVNKRELDAETFRQAAISGVISSLNDRETNYISPADLKAGALDLGSTYQGIGASVSDRTGAIEIVAPFRDSPAEKAGIQAGDIVLEVDGERTDGWSDQEAVQRIRGPKGTPVTLTVKHRDGKVEEITVTRGDIQIESVFTVPGIETIPGESGEKLVDRSGAEVTDIGYVQIAQFHDKTHQEFLQKLGNYEKKGYKGLILDLRSNPGGLLSTTVQVADEFLNSGIIIGEVNGAGQEKRTSARAGGILTRIPVVILQDAGSASGAEVLAAALRDNGRAKIIGTRSYGKGTVNQLFELKNCGDRDGCGALYVAVARWTTPKGDQIEGLGVNPDIELPMTNDQYIDEGDIQVFKAIEILRGQ